MFKHPLTLEYLNQFNTNTLVAHLGIEFTEVGSDYLVAKMPVDSRTVQPMGILHGGASVVLAETLGSVAGTFCLEDLSKEHIVGLEINANHIRGVRSGWVYGRVSPVHIGRSTQIWEIKISNEEGKLTCISRITLAVIAKGVV
jgi:1,4-dihydroxy-2-naphthoyl-CoA hydrolase